jgi:Flp pilus assembly protein TadG
MRVCRAKAIGRRRGATMVESAIVIPVVLLFTLGTCIVGLGIYRYQQVATLAREGARYASVHGSEYESANSTVTASDIYTNAIVPLSAGLNTNNLSYSIQWGTATSGSWVWSSWDSVSPNQAPTSANPNSTPAGAPMYNGVQVTVTYKWSPEFYLTGPINLTSTSIMPMSY